MRAILGYIVNMIPYMVITIPIYLLIRFVYLKSKHKKLNWHHEVVLFLFVIFIVGLASQTIIPKFETGIGGFKIVKSGIHETNLIPFKVLFETYNEVFVNGYINYFLINFLGNIILFMPFGFIIPLLWKVSDKKVIVLTRGTDVDDLILNTLGVVFGLLCYKLLYKKFNNKMDKFRV